ncbi:hypothetical protein [Labilibaculum sp.]
MKKTLYTLVILFLLGIISTSCAVDKRCPAYTKANTSCTSKTV